MGIRSLHIRRWTGGNWGALDKEAARPCSSGFLFFSSLCLSVCQLCDSFGFCFAPSCATTDYSYVPRLLCSSSCLIFLLVLIGRLWEKQLCSDIQFSFKRPQLFWEQLWFSSGKACRTLGKCRLHQGMQLCPPSPASQLFSISCPVSVWLGSHRLQDLLGKMFLPFSVCNMLYERAARHRLFIVTAEWAWDFTGSEHAASADLHPSAPSVLLAEGAATNVSKKFPVGNCREKEHTLFYSQ